VTIKIEAVSGDRTAPVDYGNTLSREVVGGVDRLCVGARAGQHRVVLDLASVLGGPYRLLYVLHTTRTGARLGRYESHELDAEAIGGFFRHFGRFFNEDARHDVWLHSHDDNATIVLDRHNIVYAYGPIDAFENVLLSAGFRRAADVGTLGSHAHHYHAEWDAQETEILTCLRWMITPLQETDIQDQG
jgi:hypothetical protein